MKTEAASLFRYDLLLGQITADPHRWQHLRFPDQSEGPEFET
jgi:hypothetical protein